jgi:hypothetical protein
MSHNADAAPTPPAATVTELPREKSPIQGEPGGTDPRDLYTIIWALFLFIRACLYILGIWIFFHSPTSWGTLGWIVLLLLIARAISYGHRWAWIGYRANSKHGVVGNTRERLQQERAEKARTRAEKKVAQATSKTTQPVQPTAETAPIGSPANQAPKPPEAVQSAVSAESKETEE